MASDFRLWNIPQDALPSQPLWTNNNTPQVVRKTVLPPIIEHNSPTSPNTFSPIQQPVTRCGETIAPSITMKAQSPQYQKAPQTQQRVVVNETVQVPGIALVTAHGFQFEFSALNMLFVFLILLIMGFVIYSIICYISQVSSERLRTRKAIEENDGLYDEHNPLQTSVNAAILAHERMVR